MKVYQELESLSIFRIELFTCVKGRRYPIIKNQKVCQSLNRLEYVRQGKEIPYSYELVTANKSDILYLYNYLNYVDSLLSNLTQNTKYMHFYQDNISEYK